MQENVTVKVLRVFVMLILHRPNLSASANKGFVLSGVMCQGNFLRLDPASPTRRILKASCIITAISSALGENRERIRC